MQVLILKERIWRVFQFCEDDLSKGLSNPVSQFSFASYISLTLTCGKAVLSCLWSESLSWLTSCNLPWVKPRFSWDSLRVSSRRSLSSNMDTMSDSKWPSESDCSGEPEPRRPLPPPPPGPSASLMVGITSHIIYNGGLDRAERKHRRRYSLKVVVLIESWKETEKTRKRQFVNVQHFHLKIWVVLQ